jgi:hypothetical protein
MSIAPRNTFLAGRTSGKFGRMSGQISGCPGIKVQVHYIEPKPQVPEVQVFKHTMMMPFQVSSFFEVRPVSQAEIYLPLFCWQIQISPHLDETPGLKPSLRQTRTVFPCRAAAGIQTGAH